MAMPRLIVVLFGFLPMVLVGQSPQIAATVSDFKLRDTNGKIVGLSSYPDAKGFIVVFTCNHCPFAKLYPGRMNALVREYRNKGVPLLAVSSTDTVQFEEDGYLEMRKRAKAGKYKFPYLQDADQAVAKAFGAQKTPHAYVIWKVGDAWEVKYNGAIDDNGAEPAKVTETYVANAVDALLAGKKVQVSETKSIGCQLHFRTAAR